MPETPRTQTRACNQANCSHTAAYRFTWPGRDEAFICATHEPRLKAIAAAMEFHIQTIPLEASDA